jgi:hypothetical protein
MGLLALLKGGVQKPAAALACEHVGFNLCRQESRFNLLHHLCCEGSKLCLFAQIAKLKGIALHIKHHAGIALAIHILVLAFAQNERGCVNALTGELNESFILP